MSQQNTEILNQISKYWYRLENSLGSRGRMLVAVVSILGSRSQRRYVLTWLRSRKLGYLLDEPSPWLTFDAIEFLKQHLRNGMRVFEYGSGGSTLFWLISGATCVSVEHDPRWFAIVRQRLESSASIDYRLITPELRHEPGHDGNPADPDDYASSNREFQGYQFRRYVSQIDSFPDEHFDIVLIDGRSRPSCIKHSVCKVKIGGMLIVDNTERPYYLAQTRAYLEAFEKKEFGGFGPASETMTTTEIYIRVR